MAVSQEDGWQTSEFAFRKKDGSQATVVDLSWITCRFGRINGTLVGALFALVGGALQAATQSSSFILVARVVTGLGTGALTGIVPVYCSEVSGADERGRFLGFVFIVSRHLGAST